MRITFLGGGNMASAILTGLAARGASDLQLHVVDPSIEKCEELQARFGVTHSREASSEDVTADVIVLAVKPQHLKDLCARIVPWMKQQLVLSIAAGITTGTLTDWLGGYQRVVWMMPNTPAQVQCGMAGLYAGPAVTAADRSAADTLARSIGQAIWVDDEAQMHRVTAISGSGPAYVFYFVEALTQAALEMGFDTVQAHLLAEQTAIGAIRLLESSGEAADSLRAKVTSKKGTTEQGILSLEREDLVGAVSRAARRAEARSIELGEILARGEPL